MMRVAIIGGGAAGLMAAATLHEDDPSVEIFLIERNDGLGKKVIISGGGRCNVTTGIRDVKTVLTKYPRGGKFLTSAMYAFPPEAVEAWFESHGVPLKTQADLRVFPVSDDGHDIVRAFEELFALSNVHILLKTSATRVEKRGDEFFIFTKESPDPIVADRLVLTTGGQAYRHTGSTGDGYAFATALGHTITPLAPSLNAFFTSETWPKEISGLSFERATITAHRRPNNLTPSTPLTPLNPSFTGPFLFTHKGVSGPAVFALSSIVAFEPYDAANPLEIAIDLFPDETSDALRSRVETVATTNPNKRFDNVLGLLVPKSLADIVVDQLGISKTKSANQVAKKDMARTAGWLKSIPLHVVQRGAGDEFVTAGGVDLSEVDPTTMESRVCPGLYFAGEILDVDGFTGGFNLQASWAAGHLVGKSIVH
ncbi:MAG: aminoacetone oxidase family FAD-binding enzyme [Candidatus Uhrbacteria bacterium]